MGRPNRESRSGRPRRTVMVEFTPEEALAISYCLDHGMVPGGAVMEFIEGRDRLNRAIRIEQGPCGHLDPARKAA